MKKGTDTGSCSLPLPDTKDKSQLHGTALFRWCFAAWSFQSSYSFEAVVRSHSFFLPTDITSQSLIVPSLPFFLSRFVWCVSLRFLLFFVLVRLSERVSELVSMYLLFFWSYIWLEGFCLFCTISDFANAQGLGVHGVNFFCLSCYICYCEGCFPPTCQVVAHSVVVRHFIAQPSARSPDSQGHGEGSSSLFCLSFVSIYRSWCCSRYGRHVLACFFCLSS